MREADSEEKVAVSFSLKKMQLSDSSDIPKEFNVISQLLVLLVN